MNWKTAGILVVAALVATAFLMAHNGGMNMVNKIVLDGGNNGGNQTDSGPHPPDDCDSWVMLNPMGGPHPPSGEGDW